MLYHAIISVKFNIILLTSAKPAGSNSLADFSDPGRNGMGSGPLAPAKPFANSFNEVDDLTTGDGAKATAEPAIAARIAEVNLAMVVVIIALRVGEISWRGELQLQSNENMSLLSDPFLVHQKIS